MRRWTRYTSATCVRRAWISDGGLVLVLRGHGLAGACDERGEFVVVGKLGLDLRQAPLEQDAGQAGLQAEKHAAQPGAGLQAGTQLLGAWCRRTPRGQAT